MCMTFAPVPEAHLRLPSLIFSRAASSASTTVKFRILRPVIGALILGILYIGLKPILSPLQLFGDYLRYFLLLFFVTVVYPLIFTKLEK